LSDISRDLQFALLSIGRHVAFACEKQVFSVPSLPTAAYATEAITTAVAQASSAMMSRFPILGEAPSEGATCVGWTAP
jgi:hypothetical protein